MLLCTLQVHLASIQTNIRVYTKKQMVQQCNENCKALNIKKFGAKLLILWVELNVYRAGFFGHFNS